MTETPRPQQSPVAHRRLADLRSVGGTRRAGIAGVAALAAIAVVLIGLSVAGTAAPPTNFSAGTLIIPMDTDTASNHAGFNQNSGMWKAYGLVYKLLQNDINVHWSISGTKTATTDTDFTATSVKDKRSGTGLGAWNYKGGPFVIDSADAAAAIPIITAWWAANGNYPNVHEAQAGFSADIRLNLTRAPRIANEAINAGITLAYYNTAGIPDLNGNPWTIASPNVLDQTEIAGGALFTQGTTCPQRKFDTFVTPHNSGYAYSLSDPTNLGTRTYSQLDTFVHQGGGWTALCHSILSNENNINDLTKNSTPAVKALFKSSLPGGIPGGFLTTNGVPLIDNTTGNSPWTVQSGSAGLPVAQLVPTSVAQALPGGSVQTWPTPGNPGAPTYYADTERVAGFGTHDNIIAGTYHNSTGAGKVTFIGGHTYATTLPYSSSPRPRLRPNPGTPKLEY